MSAVFLSDAAITWFALQKYLDEVFEISRRKSTVRREVLCGVVQFISCLYVLAVIPKQYVLVGMDQLSSTEITALACSAGCIMASVFTNLPFVIAPPTAVSIYLVDSMQQMDLSHAEGSSAVILSGLALFIISSVKPLSDTISRLIPECIQASTSVGIGLMTALAGLIELKLVVPGGRVTLLQQGPITPEVCIALLTTLLIALMMHFKIKGSFMFGLIFGTVTSWLYFDTGPDDLITSLPLFDVEIWPFTFNYKVASLMTSLTFLYVVTGDGLGRSLSDQAELTTNSAIPQGHRLFMICGLTTALSGLLSGPPILISPESAGGIKAGAKTGLSTLVCGLLFGMSLLFCRLFRHVPAAASTPLLIFVGMMLFVNSSRIKWNEPQEAIPSFFVVMLIPFTYSIVFGVGIGYLLFVLIKVFSCGWKEKEHGRYTTLELGIPTKKSDDTDKTTLISSSQEMRMSLDMSQREEEAMLDKP